MSTFLSALFGAAAVAQSGTFTALTYNVAGLPQAISKANPKTNTPIISERLEAGRAGWDIVNVQEDFSYDKPLMLKYKPAYSTPHSGDVLVGSGLRTFSAFPFTDLVATKWIACDINEADCLTPKGFTSIRVSLAPGVSVDVYNLHSDAGDKDGDFDARRKGYAQLVEFIGTYSAGAPVVLLGDTNTRYTAAQDPARVLSAQAGLTDVWVSTVRGGVPPEIGPRQECPFPVPAGKEDINCELIDKIYFRSSPLLQLSASDFTNHNSAFLDAAGKPLSDHFPISAKFAWKASSTLKEAAEGLGGNGGTFYSDLGTLPQEFEREKYPRLTSLAIQSGSRVDGLIYKRADAPAEVIRGGEGGTRGAALAVGEGEAIVSFEACEGVRFGRTTVWYVKATTNLGKSVKGGKRTEKCRTWKAPGEKWGLVGFRGKMGSEIDRVKVVWGVVF